MKAAYELRRIVKEREVPGRMHVYADNWSELVEAANEGWHIVGELGGDWLLERPKQEDEQELEVQ